MDTPPTPAEEVLKNKAVAFAIALATPTIPDYVAAWAGIDVVVALIDTGTPAQGARKMIDRLRKLAS